MERARAFDLSSSRAQTSRVPGRAGTGLKFAGSGRARALEYGLGSGSGLAFLSMSPSGLAKFSLQPVGLL